MAVLTIRKLPEEVRTRLRVRAARGGRSMEAEARSILTAACSSEVVHKFVALQDWVDKLYGSRKPRKTVEALIVARRKESGKE